MLKSSATMYDSSGSQFFRTTTGIQSGPDTFDESRFVTKLLYTIASNNIALSDAEDTTSGPLNRGGIADLPLLRTLLAICQKT